MSKGKNLYWIGIGAAYGNLFAYYMDLRYYAFVSLYGFELFISTVYFGFLGPLLMTIGLIQSHREQKKINKEVDNFLKET